MKLCKTPSVFTHITGAADFEEICLVCKKLQLFFVFLYIFKFPKVAYRNHSNQALLILGIISIKPWGQPVRLQ